MTRREKALRVEWAQVDVQWRIKLVAQHRGQFRRRAWRFICSVQFHQAGEQPGIGPVNVVSGHAVGSDADARSNLGQRSRLT